MKRVVVVQDAVLSTAELTAIAAEAAVTVDAAIRSANSLALHHIVESADFERLMSSLHDVAAMLDRARRQIG